MGIQTYVNAEHQQIFEQTKHIPGWQVSGDSEKLYELAYTYGDVILEIGTFGGRSATVELRGALANPERSAAPQFYGLDIDIKGIWRTLTSLDKEKLAAHALLYHGNLQQFIEAFPIQPTMVFVDGDHRYEGVMRDLMSLAGFLAPGTPVLCHDYTNPENDTGELGVRQAINEFVAQGYASFVDTFGCSAFIVMSDKAQGPVQQPLSPQMFYRRKAELLVSYALDMQSNWHNSEGDRQARGALIQQQQEQISHLQKAVQGEPQSTQPHQEPLVSLQQPQAISQDKTVMQLERKLQRSRKKEEQLYHKIGCLEGQIAAMETSKFWKLRSAWFRIKQAANLEKSQ